MENNHKNNKKNIVILLTACITPGDISFLERRDPNVRLRDYIWSLKLWLGGTDTTPIIFCENSNHELSEIKELVEQYNPYQKSVELLSFYGQNFSGHLGKGYGDMGIISHVLQNSSLIQDNTMVLKVTGRNYVKNAMSIIERISKKGNIDVFCDLRENLTWADGRFFCASTAFLKDFLLPFQEKIDDSRGIYLETVLARAIHLAMAQGLKWALLPSTPIIQGVYATANQPYKTNFIHRLLRESHRFIKEAVLAK
jgi:hypothetical protein